MVCWQSCLTPPTLQLLCCISTTACHMVCRQSCLTLPTLQLLCCISTTACHMVCRQSCLTPPTLQLLCCISTTAYHMVCSRAVSPHRHSRFHATPFHGCVWGMYIGRVVAADFNIYIYNYYMTLYYTSIALLC